MPVILRRSASLLANSASISSEISEKIRQASKDNHVLVMNRYYHSNLVYGMANGLNESWLESLDEGLPKSDMVILLDVTQDESFRRKSTGRDKFESDDSFIRKVSRMYKTVAKRKHWKIIDAKMDRKKVHEQILSIVEEEMDC